LACQQFDKDRWRFVKMRSRLKQVRISAGYTQQQLAVKIGVAQQTISKYETEIITPSHFKIMRTYEKLFGVQAEELFPDVFLNS
jgi:DNA-binding XRE family transcriptional regulator